MLTAQVSEPPSNDERWQVFYDGRRSAGRAHVQFSFSARDGGMLAYEAVTDGE
jgi:hypothetical protein